MIVDIEHIRAKLLIAATINIFEPVSKSVLIEKLKNSIEITKIETILDELVKSDMVVKEKDYLRLTHYGYKAIIHGKGRKLRDIYRMKYLFEITQQRGGGDSRTTPRRP